MELSDVGEHVFAAQRILKQRIRKVLLTRVWSLKPQFALRVTSVKFIFREYSRTPEA